MKIKELFFFLSYYLGIIPLFYLINKKKQVILNYHHILPDDQIEQNLLYGYCHSQSNFQKQLEIIQKRFKIVTPFDLPDTVVITFDDGALNNYRAFQLLKEKKLGAYFFLVDERIEQPDYLLWIDQWFLWIAYIPYGNYLLSKRNYRIQSPEDRLSLHHSLWEQIMEDYSLKKNILDDMEQAYSFEKFSTIISSTKERLYGLNLEQVEEMKENDCFIGFHSRSHQALNKLYSQQLENELIPKHTSVYNTTAMAIPFGTDQEINESVIQRLKQKGYDPVLLNQRKERYQCKGRISLPDTANRYEIHAYLSGWYYFVKNF